MIVSGTGHRPNKLGGYSLAAQQKLVRVISAWLAQHNVDRVIMGVALGFDQALALAAFGLNIPVTAAVPFLGQESQWPESSQDAYRKILEKCDRVVIVCPGGFTSRKMQVRNEWMVDQLKSGNDNVLLTISDGSKGGTENCLEYARKIPSIEIVNLYDAWKMA